ncbi:hypothetical protein AAFF_G00271210 [Aldrovandia affinis]|uniref:Beta-adaptin appendage C-terminal subdomain domain-containing protein n=1 Tax=Aldrovandia affinis TaxID=143900 RepID=A0AAD7RAZ8_9TELE|nr:hypothetical protein AAFF_G00271210 [Aldrovandia affinis]
MPYLGSEETVKELKRALSNPNVQSDRLRYRNVILRVIRFMTQGLDMSLLYMEMVKASATVDIVQKKLVYLYMCTYAGLEPDLALLAINTLRKDCADPSPMVRGLALRSMCNLRMPGITEYIQQPVLSGLRDKASYVRRVAVLGCAKMQSLQPDAEIDGAVVNELYGMLRDPDPVVMVNCLRALEEILKGEGVWSSTNPSPTTSSTGRRVSVLLSDRLSDLDSWGQSETLTFLLRYRPGDEAELFDILNLLDGPLQTGPAGVTAATLRLFLQLAAAHPAVQADALARARPPAGRVLQPLAGAELRRPLPRPAAPAQPAGALQRALQALLLRILGARLPEVPQAGHPGGAELAQAAIFAVGRIGRMYSESCLAILTRLLGLKQEHITSAVVQTFRDLVWLCPQVTASVCQAIPGCEDCIQDSEGKQALIWLLGVHGDQISIAPYVLEEYIDGLKTELSPLVKTELLTATVRLFLSRPAEAQDMLGRLLHYCIEDERDVCVRDSADVLPPAEPVSSPESWPMLTTGGRSQLLPQSAAEPVLGAAGPEEMTADGTADGTGELCLTLEPTLSPEDFEKHWLRLEMAHSEGLARPASPPETLQAALQLVKIQALAFSRPDASPWKAYLYAHSPGSLILAELLQTGSDPDAVQLTVKQEPEDQLGLRAFVSCLQSVLRTLTSDAS